MCIRLLGDFPRVAACQCAGRTDVSQNCLRRQPSSVGHVVCSRAKGQASHLTEGISDPKINSESLGDSGRKPGNHKLIDCKSPSYPDPNLGDFVKLCANPDVFASGLSNCHPVLFSLLPLFFSSTWHLVRLYLYIQNNITRSPSHSERHQLGPLYWPVWTGVYSLRGVHGSWSSMQS